MLIRASIVIAAIALAASMALAPISSFSQDGETDIRCGKKYMTLMVTGGQDYVTAGPLAVRKSDVRAIYMARRSNELTMFIDIGKTIIRATIEPDMLKPVVECLD